MIQREDLAVIGKINKTHGIKGELSVSIFNDAVVESLAENSCLIMDMDGIFTPFFVKSVRPRGSEAILVTFDGYDSQEEVAAWTGKEVYIERDKLAKLSENKNIEEDDGAEGFYASQLIGYIAVDGNGAEIGEIVDIDDSTDNVLFVIQRGDHNVLVPIVDEFIDEIDTENTILKLSLPDGLLHL